MKTIINAIKHWVNGKINEINKKIQDTNLYIDRKIKDSTADWNENDETSTTYIKNRPFYEVANWITYAEEQVVTFDSSGYTQVLLVSDVWSNSGQEFKIIFDGEEYSGTVWEDGSACYRLDFTTNSGVTITVYDGSHWYAESNVLDGDHTIAIYLNSTIIVQIDSKYLPDNPSKMDRHNAVCTNSFRMYTSTASGSNSHAIGDFTTASGLNSHAEGYWTKASGENSHVEGKNTVASGDQSHAEGGNTTASGSHSHAEGYSTVAQRAYQHVQGRCNILDTNGTGVTSFGKYLHIVGNGQNVNARSNAHTLDWNGNAWYQGDVYVGSTSGTNKDDGSKKLATEEYVSDAITDSKTEILDINFITVEDIDEICNLTQ